VEVNAYFVVWLLNFANFRSSVVNEFPVDRAVSCCEVETVGCCFAVILTATIWHLTSTWRTRNSTVYASW